MNEIEIRGVVVSGCGRFRAEIHLPDDLISGHEAWMASFVQGTLNIQFPTPSLPQPLRAAGLRGLDLNQSFVPAIYRVGTDVPNNTIQPNANNSRRGDLQLWRAVLRNLQAQTEHNCFLIRRVDSGYRDKAEILGQQNFRDECQFEDGHHVTLQVFAGP